MKDSNRSGTSTEAASKAQRAFQSYAFLSWLDDFMQIRQGKNNLSTQENDQDVNDINEGGLGETSIEDDDHGDTDTEPIPTVKNSKRARPSKQKKPQETLMDNMEMSLIRDLSKEISQKKTERVDDKEDLFAKSIAADLKDMPPFERMNAKNEIRNILFKYQMAAFSKQVPVFPHQARTPQTQGNVVNPINQQGVFVASNRNSENAQQFENIQNFSSPPSTPGSWGY